LVALTLDYQLVYPASMSEPLYFDLTIDFKSNGLD